MVEGHCAKRYADDARQKCVGKRVVEIIWRADARNEANVERCARGRRLVAVDSTTPSTFFWFFGSARQMISTTRLPTHFCRASSA